jgi:hypothetical protein
MHKNEAKRALMFAHAAMVFIVVLEINEAHFPQNIFICRLLGSATTNFCGINALFIQ